MAKKWNNSISKATTDRGQKGGGSKVDTRMLQTPRTVNTRIKPTFGVGEKSLSTKIPIERPSGRPSAVETIMLNELIRNAAIMKGWLIVNNRVATGEAANSIRIKIVRSKAASELAMRKITPTVGAITEGTSGVRTDFSKISGNINRASQLAKATDIGYVRGTIVGAPHLKYALQGRGPGKPPPIQDILNWMMVKGVGHEGRSLSQQAYFIAKRIGEVGTLPPHFNIQMRTSITKVSAARLVRSLATVFPGYVGNRYVNTLVALGDLWDNLSIRRVTPEHQQFEDFI